MQCRVITLVGTETFATSNETEKEKQIGFFSGPLCNILLELMAEGLAYEDGSVSYCFW